MPVDYDAIAKQHGGTATVDYDAIAARHGGSASVSQPQQEGFTSSLLHGLGLPGSVEEAKAVAQRNLQPGQLLKTAITGPVGILAEGVYNGGKRVAGEVSQAADAYKHGNTAGVIQHTVTAIPFVGPALDKASDQYADKNYAGEMGTLTAGAIQVAPLLEGIPGVRRVAGAAADTTTAAARRAAVRVGDAAQDAGTRLMNNTVGTLKADFKRGANPGRGYMETGNGPSISMQSIANKAAAAKKATGQQLGAAYEQSTANGVKVPVEVVAQELAKPLQEAISLETGPGGTGNLASIQSYIKQFESDFARAEQNGGFTPSELFEMKKRISKNTNWSDPTQFNLKAVRQQQTGALSGILSDAVPETRQLNQTYQDLTKMAGRAQERANTGSRPLTAHIYKAGLTAAGALAGGMEGNALLGAATGAVLDSVPAKTTLAAGLFRGGKALSSLGEKVARRGVAAEEVAPGNLGGNGAYNKPGNPQIPPPGTSGPSANATTPFDRWASVGAKNVLGYIANDSSTGLTEADVTAASATPQGRQLLLQASSLKPDSPVLKSIVKKIPRADKTAERYLPSSDQPDISWVAVDKATGNAVMETFSTRVRDAINRDKFDVVPISEYLGNLNRKIRDNGAVDPVITAGSEKSPRRKAVKR